MRQKENSYSLKLRRIALLTSAALLLPVLAQAEEDQKKTMEVITIMGSRLPADLSSVPGSVQVLDMAEIEKYSNLTSDIGRLLEQAVPGMATNQNDASNFTNVIRGREPSYLIDGFPQTLPLRGGGRDMRIIDPSAVERIEIIRGATSLYGQGGAGGYINYITRRPSKEKWELSSEVGLGTSLSKFDSDSLTFQVRQLIMGGMDKWDVLLSAFYEDLGVYYDGQGDPIPPDPFQQGGVSEAKTKSFLGKLGFDFTEDQRLEGTFNYYRKAQHTDVVASTAAVTGSIKSLPVPKNSPTATAFGNGPIDPFTKNIFIALNYMHQDIMGSTLKLQGMYQDYLGTFPFNPAYVPSGGTSTIEGEKYSLRMDITTPLPFMDGNLLWGAEWTEDTTGQTVLETGGTVMPLITLDSYAAFMQFHLSPASWLTVNGGLRYEDAKLHVPDYQTALQYRNANNPALGYRPNAPVTGGNLSYNDLLFNLGVVADVAEDISVFAAFSQGFTVTDIGRVLRGFSGGSVFDRVGETDPQITNNYELGVRTRAGVFSGSLAFYFNESSLGSSWDPITLDIQRAPERVWGMEAVADVNLDKFRFGGTLGWANSEVDENDDGVYESKLNYWRVPPVKLTAYAEYDFRTDWTMRLQGLKVFDSNRFPDTVPYSASAESPINGYFVLDFSVSGKAGPGELSLGIQNLLNKEYFSVLSQTATAGRPELYVMAPGASALLKYRINY